MKRMLIFLTALLLAPPVGLQAAEPVPVLVVPVRVHLMQSVAQPKMHTTLIEVDVQRIFSKVNRIWSQAGISFEIESVHKTQAIEVLPEAKFDSQHDRVKATIPKESLSPAAVDVCYVKEIQPNGFYYGEPVVVKDTATLTEVPGGMDEPIPRVTAHELGHALGLKHRQDTTNVMTSRTSGFSLNEAEIRRARSRASTFQTKAPKDTTGEPATIKFTGGNESEFQTLLDKAPAGAVVICEQSKPLEISTTLLVRKPVTLRGFKACLQPQLGKTPILIADAEGVTLTDIEMRGNYDTVDQKHRAPLIHIKRGGFRIERCKFFDGSKDGIMVTPEDGAGDIVGGVIRDIEGARMGRDLVSLSGGNGGLRIRDVTVENVRLKTGFLRGAVEVSDGTDNITVRHVVAEDAVYAIDVQDHGAVKKKTGNRCAPNTKVLLEDVTAVRCKHIVRTANHAPPAHADLTLRDFTGRDCQEPVRISNTTRVLIENLCITNEKPLDESPVELRNDQQIVIRNVTVKGTAEGVAPVVANGCTDVKMERVTCNGTAVAKPAISTEKKKKKDGSTKKNKNRDSQAK